MKTRKKLIFGLALAFSFIFLSLGLLHRAIAASPIFDQGDWDVGHVTYTVNDSSTITAGGFSSGHADVSFSKKSNTTYVDTSADPNSDGVCTNPTPTITLSGSNPLNDHPIKATISLTYRTGTNPCNATAAKAGSPITITNNTSGGGTVPGDTGPKTVTYNGQTYTQVSTSYPTVYALDTNINNNCYGGSLLILNKVASKANSPVDGTIVSTQLYASGVVGDPISKHAPIPPGFPLKASTGTCGTAQNSNDVTIKVNNDGSATLAGTCSDGIKNGDETGVDTGGRCAQNPNQSSNTTPTCESNFSFGFEWVFCPALRLADSAAGAFSDFVEGQLCVNTTEAGSSGTTTGSGVSCPGSSIYGASTDKPNGVKTAWTVFKNIASALLVILLLIMVISQAVGGGVFDAYTVKKTLPKIVAAVILMQISWFLTKFAIDLSNDLGVGIRNLLAAPFGGWSNMDIDKLVGYNLHAHSIGVNNTWAFFAVIAAGIGALAISLPMLALLALYVVLALFTAFIVLILRKLFLITLIILVPVALILWILPGTERYWKMWSTNFTKLLLMFPLIMALIAGGRIFAFITAGAPASAKSTMIAPQLAIAHFGPLPVPYFASVSSFVDLAIIILAYFGPYFLLPKAFSWGGQLMELSNKNVKAGLDKLAFPATDYFKWRQGLSPWKQARAARRAEVERRTKAGFYEGLASEGPMGNIRRARLGGIGLRGNERELRGRIRQQAEAEIERQRKEDEQRAVIQLMQRDLPQFHADSQDAVREAIATGKTARVRRLDGRAADFDGAEYARTHPHGQWAALERALVHGQNGVIDQYYTEAMNSGNAERIAEATRFKDAHADVIGTKLMHVLKGFGVAVRANESEIAQMSGHEVESIIAEYSTRSRDPARSPAERAEAQNLLEGFLQRHSDARRNLTLRGSVDLRGTAAVDAYTEILTSPNPAAPPTVAARAVINEINTGAGARTRDPTNPDADREANRNRYQTPGLPPDQTIPLIRV